MICGWYVHLISVSCVHSISIVTSTFFSVIYLDSSLLINVHNVNIASFVRLNMNRAFSHDFFFFKKREKGTPK